MKIKYFKSASGFRRWLEVNHARRSELWVGFFKKDSGKQKITAPRATKSVVIDGVFSPGEWSAAIPIQYRGQ